MPRAPNGYTLVDWNAIPAEEKKQILKERKQAYRTAYMKKYQKENADKVRQHSLNTYYRHKDVYIKRMVEHQRIKKIEQKSQLETLTQELEYYKERTKQLEDDKTNISVLIL